MASHYLELGDGIIVEVGSPGEKREEMHNAALERVDSTFEMVGSFIEKMVRPIGQSFVDLKTALDVPIEVKEAEIEIGLSFSAEGNIFVTKAAAEGSLSIRITFAALKPDAAVATPKQS